MSKPEAIEAIVLSTSTNETKSKGRVRKVTFEIPAQGPNPFEGMGGERIHIVCVRLNNDETPALPTQEPPDDDDQPRRRFTQLPAASQIAMACQSATFREYLRTMRNRLLPDDASACDGWLKGYLGVQSKREVVPGTEAFGMWAELHGAYEIWLKYERAA